MRTETWIRLAAIGVAVLAAALVGYAAIRVLTGILLPFAAAALTAAMLRPAALRLQKRTRLPEKACGAVLIVAAAILLSWLCLSAGRQLYDGAVAAAAELTAELDDPGSPLARFFRTDSLFLASPQRERLAELLTQMLREAAASVSSALTSLAGTLLMELPRALLAAAVGVIALFYLLFDWAPLTERLGALFGRARMRRIRAAADGVRRTLGACLRAYLLLLAVTFGELLVGFLLLRVAHPARAAAWTALVDFLPVLGVGTVLVPWALFLILTGEIWRGAGMAALFLVMYLVRQWLEPRLLGTTLGIHPLFTLIAVYAGLRLCGIGGALVAPLLLAAGRAAFTGLQSARRGAAAEAKAQARTVP